MTKNKKSAFVLDLDGTICHTTPVSAGFPIRGATQDAFVSPKVMDRLSAISRQIDIIIATGRADRSLVDFKSHFKKSGVKIYGWIMEHGAVVEGFPEWKEKVLKGIQRDETWRQIESIVVEYGFPIDIERYRHDRLACLVFSGSGTEADKHFLDSIFPTIHSKFRMLTSGKKITLIPRLADKYNAFEAVFLQTHELAFAAGDHYDDLTILQHAHYPLTTGNAFAEVKACVQQRSGFVSELPDHEGSGEMLEKICQLFES